jgi:putative SOS response-associated peptidase YedK
MNMCGRYAIIDGKKILESFRSLRVKDPHGLFQSTPHYNAAPMQRLPVFAMRHDELVIEPMQWWLVPHWSKDGRTAATTFNAKSETVATSRLFAPYFKSSRCLVPAEAFYEWKAEASSDDGEPEKKRSSGKQPYCIRMKDERPFMFAGLFSVWKDAEENEHPSFSILTTVPNAVLAPIHTRMPVILPEAEFGRWLDRSFREPEAL